MSWLSSKAFLAALSVLISLILWLVVQSQAADHDNTLNGIPLELRNLPEGLAVVSDKDPVVNLTAHGPDNQVGKIHAEDLKPYVDLSRATPAAKKGYSVKLDRANKDKDHGVNWTLGTFTLTIERIESKDMRVGVVTAGTVRDPNMFFLNATVEPAIVTVSGPESLCKQAKAARVFLDLATIGAGNAQSKEVEILDGENHPITGLKVEPKDVLLRPVLGAADQNRMLLVVPSFQGTQPDLGFQVTKYSATPAQVEFAGPSEALARLRSTTVPTDKIDLTGLRQSATITVDLDLTKFKGLTPKTKTVKVHVQIEPVGGTPTLQPQGP